MILPLQGVVPLAALYPGRCPGLADSWPYRPLDIPKGGAFFLHFILSPILFESGIAESESGPLVRLQSEAGKESRATGRSIRSCVSPGGMLYRMRSMLPHSPEHSSASSETSRHNLRSYALHHADYASIIYRVVS